MITHKRNDNTCNCTIELLLIVSGTSFNIVITCCCLFVYLQVVLILVLVRWIIGFVFPRKDLRYLDTALPKWMYQRPSQCCQRQRTKERKQCLEMGNLMIYEEEPYQRPTTSVSEWATPGNAWVGRAARHHRVVCQLCLLVMKLPFSIQVLSY